MPDESFGDIGHDRGSRSLNLPTQTNVIFPSIAQTYRLVDLPRQLSGFFPTIRSSNLESFICQGIVYLVSLVCSVYLVEEIHSVFPGS